MLAGIAQSVEHFTRNEGVEGSSPFSSFMGKRSYKNSRATEERSEFTDIKKPTRFDNSHKPRKIDYLDEDDGRERISLAPHMKRSIKGDFDDESLYFHDLISLVVHVIFVIALVVIGIISLKIFPVVVLAVLIIMLLMGFLLRQAPFFLPFGIALLALIVGVIFNNVTSVLIGLPAMYGMIILTRDL